MEWNYTKAHKYSACRLLVKGYIVDLLLRLGHTKPAKPQLSPHKIKDINYGSSIPLSLEEGTSPQLENVGITKV